MTTTVVIGASGPLGRATTAELSAAGQDVTGVSRSGGAGTERLDVTDAQAAGALLARVRPDAVVYLARPDPAATGGALDSAVESIRRFAEQCAQVGASRFVFASSAAVYGTGLDRPAQETDPVITDSPYAELKVRSEQSLLDTDGITAVSLRVFNVWGPGFHDSLVNRLALDTNPVIYETDGYVRDYVHSSDVARAFRLATELADAPVTLNVGTGIGIGNHQLLGMFPSARHRAHPDSGMRSYSVAAVSRIRELWQFDARVAVADAVLYPDHIR